MATGILKARRVVNDGERDIESVVEMTQAQFDHVWRYRGFEVHPDQDAELTPIIQDVDGTGGPESVVDESLLEDSSGEYHAVSPTAAEALAEIQKKATKPLKAAAKRVAEKLPPKGDETGAGS